MSSLYLLAAPSTPETTRDEIIQRAKSGEKISHEEVKSTVSKAKSQQPKSNTKGPQAERGIPPEKREQIAAAVLDDGKTYEEARVEAGVSNTAVRRRGFWNNSRKRRMHGGRQWCGWRNRGRRRNSEQR